MRVETNADVQRLQKGLRDLVALSAIPAVWIGSEPPAVAAGLADAMVGLLQLDFSFVRLSDPGGTGAVEVTRGSAWTGFPEWLERRLATSAPFLRMEVVSDIGGDGSPRRRRGLAVPVGVNGEGGVVAAASQRSDFPTSIDQVLLSLAANHATTAFQSARLIHERRTAEEEVRSARDELEVRVAERAAELGRSEAYLAEAQRLTHTGSFAIDASTRQVSHSSDEHTRLYGFDPEHGTPSLGEFFQRIHPQDRGPCARALERGFREATNIDVEYRVVLPQSPVRHHRAIAHPVFDASGEVGEVVGTIVDVTDRRRAETELERLAGEQAALRRVATLVAKESAPADVFLKVAEEVAKAIGDVDCALCRVDADETIVTLAAWGTGMLATIRTGERFPVDGDSVVACVLRQGRPCRIDDYSAATGSIAQRGREHGIRSAAGCPIVVGGHIWGVVAVATYEAKPLRPETETRVAQFTDLVATAIANAEARAEVERLAEEQAALRRVATLVAEGASPTAVFDAVAAEMERLLDADGVTLSRYEPGAEVTVVACRGSNARRLTPGTRARPEDDSVSAMVRRTERAARVDTCDRTHGARAELVRTLGVRAAVGAPIVVDGGLWGVVVATWNGEEPPPADTEQRMAHFAPLLDTAIANADSRDQLTASRTRLLTAGDDARRRVVRDLHDGAQQRLVHAIVSLKLAERALQRNDGTAESLVSQALEHAQQGNDELRELAHGILPSVLTRGFRAAVDAVVMRLDLPVRVDVPAERFPADIEASAYFIVAEALTNVVKHAHAGRAEVRASVEDGMLQVEVHDDGLGGADPMGHGLVGMGDRVTALGGRLRIDSPAGGGTLVAATLPLPGG